MHGLIRTWSSRTRRCRASASSVNQKLIDWWFKVVIVLPENHWQLRFQSVLLVRSIALFERDVACDWLRDRSNQIYCFSLALLSNIHFIIPLLSFLTETIPKLTRKTSETVTRTAALSSLISRFPSDSVINTELFIQCFRVFLLWELSQELKASFHLERSDLQVVNTKSSLASFLTMLLNFNYGLRVGVCLLWPLINTQYRCIRFDSQ